MGTRLATGFGIFSTVLVIVICGQTSAMAQDGRQFQLPAYYKDVVTPTQKAKIYELKAKYSGKLTTLEAQLEEINKQAKLLREAIDELEKDEDAAIEGVLTPEQLAKVKKMYAEAQAARAEAALKAAEEAAKAAGNVGSE